MRKILVVDDDPHIREVVCFALQRANYKVETAGNGVSALDSFKRHEPDLVVLDVGMPEMDGLEVCRQLRKTTEVPILFLSARDDEIDRVLGLEIGGDDYVTKPFSPRELVARVSNILRRTTSSPISSSDENELLGHGVVQLDTNHRSARAAEEALDLTALEFDILKAFLKRPRLTFTRDQLINSAYPDNIHVSDRTIDSHIRNIRSKLASTGVSNVIETVHGVGFRLGTCEADG